MEREVTLVEVQGGDTIRVKDKIGHGTEWTGKLRITGRSPSGKPLSA